MPLVPAKCTNCGGSLEVDNSQKAAICPYCGQAYIVEEAINRYSISVHANTVIMNDDRTSAARLEAGETFLSMEYWDNAIKAYSEATDLKPQNYEGWWGLLRAFTREFTADIYNQPLMEGLQDLFDNAIKFAPKEKQEEIYEKYKTYFLPKQIRNQKCEEIVLSDQRRLQNQTASLERELDQWDDKPVLVPHSFLTKSSFLLIIPLILSSYLLFWKVIPWMIESMKQHTLSASMNTPSYVFLSILIAMFFIPIIIIVVIMINNIRKKHANQEREKKIKEIESTIYQNSRSLDICAEALYILNNQNRDDGVSPTDPEMVYLHDIEKRF